MRRTHHEHLWADSDARLVELARGGSRAAFEAIVLRYQEPLLRHCRQMLTPAEAEDAVQEAFLSAFRTIDRTGPDLRLGGWLFRIAHNAALVILRRRVSTLPLDQLPAGNETGDEALLRRVQLRDTLAAISTLPPTEQHALLQRALAGRGHREIALSLGRSEGAVRQLLHRARTRLRDCVAALSPLVVRFTPSSGDDRLTAASLAAKGGAVLAVGVTAVGGGAAVLSAGPAHGGGNAPNAGVVSQRVASAGTARTVSALVLRSSSGRWVAGMSRQTASHPGARARGRATDPVSAHRRARSASAPVRKGIIVHAQTAAPHQRAAALSGSSITRRGAAPATSASTSQPAAATGQPATSTGQPAAATGQRAAATGQPAAPRGGSAMTPGRSGAAPGHAGVAPGELGTAPGQSAAAPGLFTAPHGQLDASAGLNTAPPGRSDAAPGHSGMPPGLSNKTSH